MTISTFSSWSYSEDFETSTLDITDRVTLRRRDGEASLRMVDKGDFRLGTSTTMAVAIKHVRYANPGDYKEVARRKHELRKEVTALMGVHHPNILPFRGLVEIDGTYGIVTDWAAGGPVMQYLEKNSSADRLDILCQVAAGLEYLHTPYSALKPTIIHGDLHSGNVLMMLDNRAVISDFGLCKVMPDDHAASVSVRPEGMPRGRVAYLAPELHMPSVSRSWSSDVFSFSILAWEMFAGIPPFADQATGVVGILLRLAQGARPERSEVPRTDFSDGLWSIVTDCWAPDPTARPIMQDVHRRLLDLGKEATSIQPVFVNTSPQSSSTSVVTTTAPALDNMSTRPTLNDLETTGARVPSPPEPSLSQGRNEWLWQGLSSLWKRSPLIPSRA